MTEVRSLDGIIASTVAQGKHRTHNGEEIREKFLLLGSLLQILLGLSVASVKARRKAPMWYSRIGAISSGESGLNRGNDTMRSRMVNEDRRGFRFYTTGVAGFLDVAFWGRVG